MNSHALRRTVSLLTRSHPTLVTRLIHSRNDSHFTNRAVKLKKKNMKQTQTQLGTKRSRGPYGHTGPWIKPDTTQCARSCVYLQEASHGKHPTRPCRYYNSAWYFHVKFRRCTTAWPMEIVTIISVVLVEDLCESSARGNTSFCNFSCILAFYITLYCFASPSQC